MVKIEQPSVISIYVSHDSEKYIKKFSYRHGKELGEKVILLNSSSTDIDVEAFSDFEFINVGENIGFSAANNIGIKHGVKLEPDYFLIINPDVYLPSGWLEAISPFLCDKKYSDVGVFTVPLLGYNFTKNKPTGLIDSLGVYRTWYGRWYDCLAGKPVNFFDKDNEPFFIPSACGALMIIRREVANSLFLKDGYVFNESFFMYKEDIELSVRVRKSGRKILMLPSVPVYHCRGWDGTRNSPYWKRLLSAKNELSMHLKYYWRFIPYSALKYFYVKYFENK